MKKTFMCSLCHNGILGGALYLEPDTVTYKTNKLTVNPKYRNLVLPIAQIREITWKQILFPVATFHMAGGEDYVFLIFNKSRFTACFEELRGTN